MPPIRITLWCALPAALLLLLGASLFDASILGAARAGMLDAQTLESQPLEAPTLVPEEATDDQPESPANETTPERADGEPLDLSTPDPGSTRFKAAGSPGSSRSDSGWDGKAGVDYRKPSIPAADLQPAQLVAGAIPDQSTGVAWANVTAPGLDSPLGWDKTSIETRVDPSQEQGRLGTTLSRSVPVGDNLAVTLQNGVSVTRTLPSTAQAASQSWASSQAVRFNILPTDTTVSFGADISSTDEKWSRTLSAEQKLFGGPFSVTGSVGEAASGETSKSLKAGFKRTW
jgi:hypothetical protein